VDTGERALVLVQQPQGVPDLVQGRAALSGHGQVPAEVHGAVGQPDRERLAAHRRPGAVTGLEPDAQFSLRTVPHLGEVDTDAEALPLTEALAYDVLLLLGAAHGTRRISPVREPG